MGSSVLHVLLAREGEALVASAHAPFFPTALDTLWWIERGGLNVFSVRVEAGAPQGARQHFCTLETGEAVFGTGAPIGGRGLLAVALPDTRLRRIPLARLRALATDVTLHAEIAALLDAWIAAVSRGVSRDISPHTDLAFEADSATAPVQIAPNIRFRSRRGLAWVAVEAGELLFIGMEELALAHEPVWFPLGTEAWLQALGPVRIRFRTTASALASDEVWRGLALFSETVGKCEALNRRLIEVDHLNRQKDRTAAAQRATSDALRDLASVLETATPAVASSVSDPTFLACCVLGREQGIAFQPPPEFLKGEPVADPVAAIARASRVRVRAVALRGDGWREELSTPVLAFLKTGCSPVALWSESPGHLMLHDPIARTTAPLTPALAAEIESAGFVFYRSLRSEAVGGWALLRFGARSLGPDFTRLLLLGLGAGLLGTLPALATRLTFETIAPAGNRDLLWQIAAGLLGVAATTAIFEIARGLALLRMEARLDNTLQAAVLDRLLKLPAPFFRQHAAGDLAQRVHGVSEIRQLLSQALIAAGLGSLFAWLNLAVLVWLSPPLAALALALLAGALLFSGGVLLAQLRAQRAVALRQGRLSALVLQLITGIAKLRVAAAEELAFAAWSREFAQQKRDARHARRLAARVTVFNAAYPLLASTALFACLAGSTVASGLSAGAFLAFIAAFGGLLTGTLALTQGAALALNALPLFERMQPILRAAPEDHAAKHTPGTLGGRIELSGVSFRYTPETPLILDRVSLDFEPGEFVAVVGPSGSGKSTLLRLLLGFETPQTGAILYDGQDLSRLDVAAVRRQIGVVLQASQTTAGSLRQNLTGARRFTDDEVWEALRLAGLDADVRALPMGLHTVLSTGGGLLSGGQRQRLMIARALIGKPRLLLFDEATSALDNRTQALVSASIAQLQATRVVIAHRLSTIREADRIIILDAGRVVQSGRYADLLQTPGPFAQLARRQLVTA